MESWPSAHEEPETCALASGGSVTTDRNLATPGAIEEDPYRQVLREVLESMLDSRGHEEEIAWPERVPPAVVKEDAAPMDDDVDLVLLVRRRLALARHESPERELGVEGAPLQDPDGVLAREARDVPLSIGNMDHAAAR
jgi:hypothetical protein